MSHETSRVLQEFSVELYVCRIGNQAVKRGFMNVPRKIRSIFPSETGRISVSLEDFGERQLTYNPKFGRVYGLSKWFKERRSQSGDYVSVRVFEPLKKYSFSTYIMPTALKKERFLQWKGESRRPSHWKSITDSSQLIGKRGEYRVIAKLMEMGLEVYAPIVDIGGVDAIIRQANGVYKEVQVKTRTRNDKREIFDTHLARRENFFVVLHTLNTEDFWILPSEMFYANRAKSHALEKRGEMRLILTPSKKKELHEYYNRWFLLTD